MNVINNLGGCKINLDIDYLFNYWLYLLGVDVVKWEKSKWGFLVCLCCYGNSNRVVKRWKGIFL